MSISFIGDI